MNKQDYEQQIEEMRERIIVLQKANIDLVNRKFQDALSITPHEFRQLLNTGREQMKE